MKLYNNGTFTDDDELISIANKHPNKFYETIAKNLSLAELKLIRDNLTNKNCNNCSNKNYCIFKNDDVDYCDGWMNKEIIGKSKILNKKDVNYLC